MLLADGPRTGGLISDSCAVRMHLYRMTIRPSTGEACNSAVRGRLYLLLRRGKSNGGGTRHRHAQLLRQLCQTNQRGTA